MGQEHSSQLPPSLHSIAPEFGLYHFYESLTEPTTVACVDHIRGLNPEQDAQFLTDFTMDWLSSVRFYLQICEANH